ncbi:helix-turn-helix domain-containing protein [Ferruginibacter profundus]
MKTSTLEDFYQQVAPHISAGISKEIGHFNVFSIAETIARVKEKNQMPYNRRTFYKISLIKGRNTAEYADKVIAIEQQALLFATPKVPYHYVPLDDKQDGWFCIFTDEFLNRNITGIALDELPIFKPGGYPVFELTAGESQELTAIFERMNKELSGNYAYKYDLLRNYVLELIHYGQKLQPAAVAPPAHNASARVTALFIELLERQFPIESPGQQLQLRTAKDYAERLSVHVNHLNKVLKAATGKTTTELISGRVIQEAKILLKQTDWNVSEISDSLGFEELAHFSNFFRKQTSVAPGAFRG